MNPRQTSALSDSNSAGSANTTQSDRSTCVVCMDAPTDIILSPCRHAHCCLKCFRRSSLHTCPVCRSAVTSIIIESTGAQLPFNPPAAAAATPTRQPSPTATLTPPLSRMNAIVTGDLRAEESLVGYNQARTNSSVSAARPLDSRAASRLTNTTNSRGPTRRPSNRTFTDNMNSAQPVTSNGVTTFVRRSTRLDFDPPQFNRYRNGRGIGNHGASRSAGPSTLHVRSVTRQAPRGSGRTNRRDDIDRPRPSAVRSAGPSTLTAHSQPERASEGPRLPPQQYVGAVHSRSSLTSVSCSLPFLSEPDRSPPPYVEPPSMPAQPKECIILIGNSRDIIVALARKLMNAFPAPKNDAVAGRLKSTIFIHGDPIRLVLIDSTPFSMRAELAARIYRQAPNLVLLCADRANVTSFEAVIRLDMEILDYLHFPCLWVLVKTGVISSRKKRRNVMNFVDDSDLRIAKHFIGSERQSLTVSVDTSSNAYSNVKKLGTMIQRSVGNSERDRQTGITTHRTPALSTSMLGLWSTFSKTRPTANAPKRRTPRASLGQCWSRSLAI